ncbi:hypothetical protein [uncultured Nostoc sp.]|uniref:hypothetical protein n=1 Tax=uncultured Nostoc sp. TaxID=340711 RepID=UPI0035C9EDF3
MYIESLSIATLEQAIHLREEVFPGVSNSSDSPSANLAFTAKAFTQRSPVPRIVQ